MMFVISRHGTMKLFRISWGSELAKRVLVMNKRAFTSSDNRVKYFRNTLDGQSSSPALVHTASLRDHQRVKEDLLECLRNRRIYHQFGFLLNTPDYFYRTGNYRQFSEIACEWFRQAKPALDELNTDRFNPAHILIRLGQINRETTGRVLANFGDLGPVLYFLQRMLDTNANGLENFPVEEVVGVLAAIRHFVAFSTVSPRPSISRHPIFQIWLNNCAKYITNKEATDGRDGFLQRHAAYVLRQLASITASSVKNLPDGFLLHLCRLAKFHFDHHLDQKKRDESDSVDQKTCYYYSGAFLMWMINPDSIVPNSWESWFNQCSRLFEIYLKQCRRTATRPTATTLQLISRFISVTVEYKQYDKFQRSFILWRRTSMEILLYYNDNIKTLPSDDVALLRSYLPDFVYNLGALSKLLMEQDEKCELEYRALIPMLDETLANVGIHNATSHNRAMSGFRNLKKYLNLINYKPSDKYFNMLTDYYQNLRKRTAWDSPNVANSVATLLFLFRDMNFHIFAHDETTEAIRELVLLFMHCFNGLAANELIRSLAYFGDACLNFNVDPARMDYSDGDFWRKYFKMTELALEKFPDTLKSFSNERGIEEEKKMVHLLSVLADISYRYQRIDLFFDLYDLYEKTLVDLFPRTTKSQCYYLHRTLNNMKRSEGLQVSEMVLDKLEMKAAMFVPKHQRQRKER